MPSGKKRQLQDSDSHQQSQEIILDHDDEDVETSLSSEPIAEKSKNKANAFKTGLKSSRMNPTDDGLDIKIPLSLLMAGTSAGSNECTLLVQVTPEDAPALDFHGTGGAIGRFETSNDGVIMDLKGYQYQGRIQPGPTCIVASMHPMIGNNMIKVECITDEFVTLHKGRDQLARLDAIVEKGDLDDSFQVTDSNINSSKRNVRDDIHNNNSNNAKQHTRKNKSGNKKRKKPIKR